MDAINEEPFRDLTTQGKTKPLFMLEALSFECLWSRFNKSPKLVWHFIFPTLDYILTDNSDVEIFAAQK